MVDDEGAGLVVMGRGGRKAGEDKACGSSKTDSGSRIHRVNSSLRMGALV
jgi:hypothetical protein